MAGIETSSVAGVVSGRNPLEYSASSPYTLFLFQAVLIVVVCQILNYPLRKIQQPRVIAEVLCGIILGPSVLGRIPNFTATCFPTAALPGLVLMANVGIIFFLFMVGLEVDLAYIRKNARAAFLVGLINMAIPFGLGCGIAKGLYDEYHDESNSAIKFTTYMVFIAVALCVTAFPVLARILVELNLIGDQVGTVVLAAGIINDLVGWMMLALLVTLANADNAVNTVYILLLTLAWFLILLFPVKYALKLYLTRFTNEMLTGEPSQMLMVIIILMVFVSAFYTDIIGVHPIFGAFMVGVIIPRDQGFVIRITEKLEDLVHSVMIPIYFAVAGLSADLGALDRGLDWGYVFAVIGLAMFGKIAGGFVSAKLNGFPNRESLAVGVLMSCKGIVEIVVLNVGLNAKIISERVYSMFLVMALVTTFLTTPLAIWVYPPSKRHSINSAGLRGPKSEAVSLLSCPTTDLRIDTIENFAFPGFVLLLRKIDCISGLMLLFKDLDYATDHVDVLAVHLRDFSSRTSHLLEASSVADPSIQGNEQDYANSVSILAIVRTLSSFLLMNINTKSILSPAKNYMAAVNDLLPDKDTLLLASVSASSLVSAAGANEDFNLQFHNILDESKSHAGVLVMASTRISPESRPISLVLDHNDRLSGLDLLCIHMAKLMAKTHHDVCIHIRSATGYNREFELQFDNAIAPEGSDVNLRLEYFTETAQLTLSVKVPEENVMENRLFIVLHDFILGEGQSLFPQAVIHKFDILIMKAHQHQ